MDEQIGLAPGTIEFVKSSASLEPVGIVRSLLSLIGVETNYSVMERAVALDYEEWVFETLMGLRSDSTQAGKERHKFGARLDDKEAREKKLNWIIEEFEKRLGDMDARIGDLMALFEAGYEVWKLNMQPAKRKILSILMKKAFDPTAYKEGRILEFIAALRQINVRQIGLLQEVSVSGRTPSLSTVTQRALDLSFLAELKLLVKGKIEAEYVITEFGDAFVRSLKED